MSTFLTFLVIWLTPTTKPYTNPCVGKSPKISNLQTESNYLDWLKCYWIFTDSRGPLDGCWWVDWGRGGCQCVGGTHADMHMYACTCMSNMINNDASMRVAICNFYTCACACMHMHVHMCVDSPYAPRCTPIICLLPKSHQEAKIPKFNKSWTNWDNSILFEDSLPLNSPELI